MVGIKGAPLYPLGQSISRDDLGSGDTASTALRESFLDARKIIRADQVGSSVRHQPRTLRDEDQQQQTREHLRFSETLATEKCSHAEASVLSRRRENREVRRAGPAQ